VDETEEFLDGRGWRLKKPNFEITKDNAKTGNRERKANTFERRCHN
jgi:hypothetical protein